MASDAPTSDQVRLTNWSGSIPVVLTLAPTSLGTTMMPHPIHLMLPRGSFLHVGLRTAIQRLHAHAPATISFSSNGGMLIRNEPEPQGSDDADDDVKHNNDATDATGTSTATSSPKTKISSQKTPWKFPVCWLEDEETQIPLRWHIFAGVLFDMLAKTRLSSQPSQSATPIPWKIRLHFFNYPSSQLLPLEVDDVWTAVERSFKSSLKQALFLQYGNSRIAMNMSRQTHQRLWDAIETPNYKLYQQINEDLQASSRTASGVQLIPIRVFLDSKPPIQRPCPGTVEASSDSDGSQTTLGRLLLDWLPDVFRKTTEGCVEPIAPSYRWLVAGISPPMTIPILELWENLCHPDHFLYIVVLTR